MTIMTIRIPDDVKAAFDKAFEGEDKDAIIARLLREAAEKRAEAEGSAERRRKAVDRILELRKQPPMPATKTSSAPAKKAVREACHRCERGRAAVNRFRAGLALRDRRGERQARHPRLCRRRCKEAPLPAFPAFLSPIRAGRYAGRT
jgi:hypothetical protein